MNLFFLPNRSLRNVQLPSAYRFSFFFSVCMKLKMIPKMTKMQLMMMMIKLLMKKEEEKDDRLEDLAFSKD
jgi:hypothetical protein